MRFIQKALLGACLAVLFGCTIGCKVSEDAIAAAQQITATANDLKGYYQSLADAESITIALNELDSAMNQIPFATASRQPLEDTVKEIRKRQDAAQALSRLAASMGALSGPKIYSDFATAASGLGNELVQVKAIPSGPPIPDLLGKAGGLLMEFVQERKEREAARAMDQTLAALVALFEKEQPAYDSMFRMRLFLASQIAKDLIANQTVDPTPILGPALKPFNLTASQLDPQLRKSLLTLELKRLQTSVDDSSSREKDASDAMLAALREMSSRVHLLATDKSMTIRGNPFSLHVVESWITSGSQ